MYFSALSCLEGEYDYVRVLNRALPDDIRVLGWSPVPIDFHARSVRYLLLFPSILVCTKPALQTPEYFVNCYGACLPFFLSPWVQVQLLC